tara:strand:+ start:17570 stop:17815 length:246 start_codon:yes stop_codon:yes gene_type:complete
MERFLQYLDDLDDLYGMAGLVRERVRRFIIAVTSYLAIASAAIGGIWFAMVVPPLAVATTTLLFVTLLYRSVTSPRTQNPA